MGSNYTLITDPCLKLKPLCLMFSVGFEFDHMYPLLEIR
jgi:hypothetical protein